MEHAATNSTATRRRHNARARRWPPPYIDGPRATSPIKLSLKWFG